MAPPVSYRVSMPRPHTHLFDVVASFPPAGDQVDFHFPVWTPGSYLVREYERHVQQLKVESAEGKLLPFTRIDKNAIRVEAGGAPVVLKYKVYANELTVRTSHLDGTHGYFNGATLFYFCKDFTSRPHHVTIDAPAGWTTSTALERVGETFVAEDFDTLVDSPFEIGPHTPLRFTAAGVPHEVVLWGEPQLDEKRLVGDLTRVVETEAQLFGGLPLKRYVFFVYASDKGRGGLEHKDSTALLYPRTGFATAKGWEDFLTLAAHEYFHLWSVKRIKPRALVPFDYTREQLTTLLWHFEGGTSYYDNLLVRRAGLMTAHRYLQRLGESLTALHTTPGRKVMPLLDASYLAWVKHYRPDENINNSAISYYLKGEVVCALLDLTVRQATNNQRSLDDVFRLLWQRYGDGRGVPEDGIEAAAQEATGVDLRGFFDRALRSTDELDYSPFQHVGLELRLRARESSNDKGGSPPRSRGTGEERPKGWLGVSTKGAATIAAVVEGSPASEAGLYADDELIALDGSKIDASGLIARTEEKKPGDKVRITVFRRERLTELTCVLGQRPQDTAWLARLERPTEAQKSAFKAWLGATWEEPSPEAPKPPEANRP